MFTNEIKFRNFKIKKKYQEIKKKFYNLFKEKNYILDSLRKNYKDNYLKST